MYSMQWVMTFGPLCVLKTKHIKVEMMGKTTNKMERQCYKHITSMERYNDHIVSERYQSKKEIKISKNVYYH